jgi:hypothetical protein
MGSLELVSKTRPFTGTSWANEDISPNKTTKPIKMKRFIFKSDFNTGENFLGSI